MKILDCTIRDGGYYTNWDFSKETVKTYLRSINKLPIDFIEVGYRNPDLSGYFGEYYFLPTHTMEFLRLHSEKAIAIILNEKDFRVNMLPDLLGPCHGLVDLVRIAIDPKNYSRALELAKEIKKMGFDVAFNVMYMSKWSEHPEMMQRLNELDGVVDYFYMVDSFGGVFPDDVRETIKSIRAKTNVNIGFHGHNNLEMALANTLAAIDEGVDIVDATITGMGRGAGNLKTELLLTALNGLNGLDVNFNALSDTVADFEKLQDSYKWGTSLPYMVSGAKSLPQKQVMEWVSKRYYSINSIVRALNNVSDNKADNEKFSVFLETYDFKDVVIVGGGPSVVYHQEAIYKFLSDNVHIPIIHASSKNARSFDGLTNEQYYCLAGSEGLRLEKVFEENLNPNSKCILPPYPRKMGTYIPESVRGNTYELDAIDFCEEEFDSHTAIALQTAINLGAVNVYLVGYDGYIHGTAAKKDQELFLENTYLFHSVKSKLKLTSLLPTEYKEVENKSIYDILK
jgi:4-hydroxy 2-oxovalerate aldolase